MEMPGATARAIESLKAGAGATNDVPKSAMQRSAVLEEQAACPEVSQGGVGGSM